MKKRVVRIIIILIIVLIALVGIIWAAAGPVAKYVVNNYGPDLVGRRMSVEKVAVNLLAGKVRVEKFDLREQNDSASFVSLNELEVKVNLWKLLGRTLQVNNLRFDKLDAQILQNGSEFNFGDIIDHFAADSTAQDSVQSESEPWIIALNNIKFDQGHVRYHDQKLDAQLGMENINLSIPALYFSSQKSDVDLQFNFEKGGTLSTRLAYNMEQGDYSLFVELDSLNLEALRPYSEQMLNITNFAGALSAAIQLTGNLNHIVDFRANGTVDAADLKADDLQGVQLARVDNLHLELNELDLLEKRCLFDNVALSGAYARVELDREGNINLAQILKPSSDTTATESATESSESTEDNKPFTLKINKLNLAGIAVDFTDHSMRQQFKYSLSDIALRSHNFDIAGTNQAVISARLNKTGRANIVWNGTLYDLKDQKLKVNIENIRLTDFSPYCYEYTAYPLTGGNMTFISDNVVSNSRLSSNNHIDVYKSTAGNKDKSYKAEYSNIPVRLGLYLLKDMEEHILMDIPVKGLLTSPEFSFRKIMLKAVGNAILKVVASPFIFLQGDKGNSLHDIAIDPLQHTFTTQQYESFNVIVDALKAKPELHIALLQYVNEERLQTPFEEMALKRDYHNSKTEKATDKLSHSDTERIAQLSYSDAELDAFINQRLIEKGLAADTIASLSDKRHTLYAEQSVMHINFLKQGRNKAIRDYFLQQGVADSLITIDNAEDKTIYKGKDRYIIEVGLGDETVSLNPEAQNSLE